MDNNLFPEGYDEEDDIVAAETETAPGYRYSVQFGQDEMDILRSGGNQILQATGEDAWKSWCVKVISTQRYACLAYSDNYGVDLMEAINSPTRATAESILTREITEAIMADPYGRTQAIESITFEWLSDTDLIVDVQIVGIDGQTADISTTLSA